MFIANHYHLYDLPNEVRLDTDIAIDTEAMGLHTHRDRLCVVQISDGKGDAHLVHFPTPEYNRAINLKKVLNDNKHQKIFHFGRFDIAIMHHYLDAHIRNVFCTKIASRLIRTYTDQHGLKELCSELLGIKISKQQQSSDWGTKTLTPEQINYAAHDVLHLHDLRNRLSAMLVRENRAEIAKKCFDFLPTRAELDVIGWPEIDIFSY